MKQQCINCHFLVFELTEDDEVHELLINQKARDAALKGDFEWFEGHPYQALRCYFGVWDEGIDSSLQDDRPKILTGIDRQGSCYFWKGQPGMALGAAAALRESQERVKSERKEHRLTRIGLWIAAIALGVNAIFQVLDFIFPRSP